MNRKEQQVLALQASGEYMMRHIGDILAEMEDKRLQSYDGRDEEILIALEAQAKAIAEAHISQPKEQLG